jgi:hypothetical protein
MSEFILPCNSAESAYARLLWKGGKQEVLNWVSSMAKGIL